MENPADRNRRYIQNRRHWQIHMLTNASKLLQRQRTSTSACARSPGPGTDPRAVDLRIWVQWWLDAATAATQKQEAIRLRLSVQLYFRWSLVEKSCAQHAQGGQTTPAVACTSLICATCCVSDKKDFFVQLTELLQRIPGKTLHEEQRE